MVDCFVAHGQAERMALDNKTASTGSSEELKLKRCREKQEWECCHNLRKVKEEIFLRSAVSVG